MQKIQNIIFLEHNSHLHIHRSQQNGIKKFSGKPFFPLGRRGGSQCANTFSLGGNIHSFKYTRFADTMGVDFLSHDKICITFDLVILARRRSGVAVWAVDCWQ